MIRYSIVLAIALVLSSVPQITYAKFMGNRPPAAGTSEAQQSQALGGQILQLIAAIFAALGAYESSGESGPLNSVLQDARVKLDSLSADFKSLAGSSNDAKVTAQQAPAAIQMLNFYKKELDLPTVSAVQNQMAIEVSVFSAALSDISFGGDDDPQKAIKLYDAIDRMIYLGAAYAQINYTAE